MSHLSYKDAGVDIAAADAFVARIADAAKSTHTAGVVPHRTEYASLFRPPLQGLHDPLIAATCDGVGTKVLVARDMGKFTGLGQDLVAMNVNDLLPAGAKPLLFLDYIATGKLEAVHLVQVLEGAAGACREAGCALLGGETAEMPDVYRPGDFDLAGFAVGLVDANQVPDLQSVQVGDQILALPATGVHSNGFSLVRKALAQGGHRLTDTLPTLSQSIGDTLLTPTPIYVRPVLEMMAQTRIKAAAHVTGGGILGRAERLLRDGQRMILRPDSYSIPPIFAVLAASGNITPVEMARTFNMGLGYLVVVEATAAQKIMQSFPQWLHVGEIVAGRRGVDLGTCQS